MRRYHLTFRLLGLLALLIRPAAAMPGSAGDMERTRRGPLVIRPLTHASVLFQWRGQAIYVDPAGSYDWASLPKADLILITHEHPDHCSPETVAKIRKSRTQIVSNAGCARQFPGAIVMRNGGRRPGLEIGIRGGPAYNRGGKAPNGQFYHPKGGGKGLILTFAAQRGLCAGG